MYRFTFVDENYNLPQNKERSKFIVDKEKRTVVCISYVVLNGLDDMFDFDASLYIGKRLKKEKLIPESCNFIQGYKLQVIGVAKCDPSDEFDEAVGKKIAETRMRQSVYKLMEKINLFASEYIMMLKDKLDFAIGKTNFLKYREIDHCKKLIWDTGFKREEYETC